MIWFELLKRRPFIAIFYPLNGVLFFIAAAFHLLSAEWYETLVYAFVGMMSAKVYNSAVRVMLYQMLLDTNPQMEK